LVFVLAALALISFLALAVLTLIRSEDRGSRTAADLTELRLMAEMPEKMVISQIRRATRGLGTRYTWTSQPGMIRVFGNDAQNGNRPQAEEMFKLYSAQTMTLPGGSDPLKDGQDFLQWTSQPGVFTDLNEPVRVLPVREQGKIQRYDQPTFVFPILDPGAIDLYDGFKAITGTYDLNPQNPKMPLPVAWLYVLKNGKIASAMPGGEGKVRVADATEDNPIIGRIAFWTDDESCKLNLNTATEPAPWEAPHTRTTTDEAYAQTIPAKGEFYRMSGHPAYTSLAPVLRKFGRPAGDTTPAVREPHDTLGRNEWWEGHLLAYHRLLPRTFDIDKSDKGSKGSKGGTNTEGTSEAVPLKQERFFSTVDEFFFNTKLIDDDQRTANGQLGVEQRFTQDDVRKSRFFLTTHSRAPELNPFNRPKISLWPVQKEEGARNTLDEAFVQAAKLGNDIYYFQRARKWTSIDPGSSQEQDEDMNDTRNEALFGYMLDLSERDIPGFGGRFADPNNVASGKYSPESRDQLLTSMFDMIRWGVNPSSPNTQDYGTQYSYLPSGLGPFSHDGIAGWSAVPMRHESYSPNSETEANGSRKFTKGFGRFPTVTEMIMVLIATDASGEDQDGTGFADVTKQVQAFIILKPFNPSPGTPAFDPAVWYQVRWLSDWTYDSQSLFATNTQRLNRAALAQASVFPDSPVPLGGNQSALSGIASQFQWYDYDTDKVGPKLLQIGSPKPEQCFELYSATIDLDATKGSEASNSRLKFKAGKTEVLLYPGWSVASPAVGEEIQKLTFEFPDIEVDLPVPLMEMAHRDLGSLEKRFVFSAEPLASGSFRMPLIRPGDVVRSVQLAAGTTSASKGDARLVAARLNPPATNFLPHADFFKPDVRQAHGLRDGAFLSEQFVELPVGKTKSAEARVASTLETAMPLVGRSQSTNSSINVPLIPDPRSVPLTVVQNPKPPDGPPQALAFNADERPGDFDTGPGIIEDGPYIGKPDFNNSVNQSAISSVSTPPDNGGYFQRGGRFLEDEGATWMPWRQASSAFIFGSLPTGVYGTGFSSAARPWQTLLLCPNPPSRTTAPGSEPKWSNTNSIEKDHFGFSSPRDHLWLEFFHLPLVDLPLPDNEPKPEATGFGDAVSTEGKVNMNYQMMPFTWIKRATAMHGALHGVRLTAIPSTAVAFVNKDGQRIDNLLEHYKIPPPPPNSTPGTPDILPSNLQFRYEVNAGATLEAFDEQRFTNGDVFRSPSEICDMWLVPKRIQGQEAKYGGHDVKPAEPPGNNRQPSDYGSQLIGDYKEMLDWWEGPDKADPTDGFEATGDNLREAPYAQLYPRLCTKSNVFTVHYRVQLLKKSRSTKPGEWDETRDTVAAEHRGQTTLERYLDLNKKTIPDFATTINEGEALDDYYNIRVVNRRDFKP